MNFNESRTRCPDCRASIASRQMSNHRGAGPCRKLAAETLGGALPPGFRVHQGFGLDIEVVSAGNVVFMGTRDRAREWAELGCPSDSQEYERLLAAKGIIR